METSKKVSIIVPVYNAEKYLDECISSLVNQTYTNLEIILVNDGSTDTSPALLDDWAKKDSRIKVIHKDNEGVSATRNRGIDCATGDYILFVDSDDYVSIRLVDKLMQHRNQGSSPACRIIRFTDIPAENDHEECEQVIRSDNLAECRNGLFAVGILYERSVIEKLHLRFDPEIVNLEDSVWNCEYLCYMPDVIYIDVPMYYYRVTPLSATSRCWDRKWQISCWIKARKSMMDWFSGQPLSYNQKKYARRTYRYCQNNIHAECVSGSVPYSDLHTMECDPEAQFDQALISIPEKALMNYCPKLYFGIYALMLRTKNAIRK